VRVALDVEHRRARVTASAVQPVGTPIAIDFAGGVPYAAVRLGARDTREAMLVDTGDSGLVSIGYDEYREDPELFAVRGSGSALGLGGSVVDTLQGELSHAEVGGQALADVPISAVRGQHAGHIGYGLAARCASLVLDLGQRRIECRPKGGGPPSTGEP
jgi:hypothetical protein